MENIYTTLKEESMKKTELLARTLQMLDRIAGIAQARTNVLKAAQK